MRVTVLEQYARGVAHHDAAAGQRLLDSLESIKWLLWHGNQHRALETIGFFEDGVGALEADYYPESFTLPDTAASASRGRRRW